VSENITPLFTIEWRWPGSGAVRAALGTGVAIHELDTALREAGFEVVRTYETDVPPAGRQSAAQSREGTTGVGGLDAGDRAAMGRLARRALYRPDPRDVSSGNGTEFS
jgi:hypothetical protein